MPAWICVTCAVQQADTEVPPERCPICEDERQYVGWEGQRWTTPLSSPQRTRATCARRSPT